MPNARHETTHGTHIGPEPVPTQGRSADLDDLKSLSNWLHNTQMTHSLYEDEAPSSQDFSSPGEIDNRRNRVTEINHNSVFSE